jgi:hypothetical protein
MRAVRKVLALVAVSVISTSVGIASVHADPDLASRLDTANSDVPELHSAGQIAYDVTSIATPGHLYEVGTKPPELMREPGD